LDEVCKLPKSTDETFIDKLQTTWTKNNALVKRKMKRSNLEFVISHFAGEVAYDAAGFLDKNRDPLQDLSELKGK